MRFEKKDLFTIPNILTYIRFLCLPFFVGLMAAYKVDPVGAYLYAGFGIFVFASVTDIVDGYVARHFNQVSDLGKVIDPIADKLLQCLGMVMLVVIGALDWWFMAILIVKEILMGVFSRYFMVASKCQVHQRSNIWGKVGAFVNFVGIVLAFWVGFSEILHWIDRGILIVGCVLAVIALVQYNVGYYRQLRQIRASGVLDTLDKSGSPLIAEHSGSESDDDASSDSQESR